MMVLLQAVHHIYATSQQLRPPCCCSSVADMIERVPHSHMDLQHILFCCPPCSVQSASDTSKSKLANLTMQATPANWPYNHDSIGKKGWAFLLPTVSPEDAKLHFPDHHSCKVTITSPAQHTLISSESCRKVNTVCTHLHMALSLSCASSSPFPDTCHDMSAALHASGPCLFCC